MIKGIRRVIKLWDDVWAMDRIWKAAKWPFGMFVLGFVLFLVWNLEINPRFAEDLCIQIKTSLHYMTKTCVDTLPNLSWKSSTPIKNIK